MARLVRVIAVDVPHHITQRGNARRVVFETDTDRKVYLELLRQQCELQHVSVLGYGLMPNHVHLIATPHETGSLAAALRHTHGRYACYRNARCSSSGHLWQGRYYSCPLDDAHLWAALRYAELNPVRAGLVASAFEYRWSSARAHLAGTDPSGLLDLAHWRAHWSPSEWNEFLIAACMEEEAERIRRTTHTGRPLGSPDFVALLERQLLRPLAPRPGGRPRKSANDDRQQALELSASVPAKT